MRARAKNQHQFSEYEVSHSITTLPIALRSYCTYYRVQWHTAKQILLQGWGPVSIKWIAANMDATYCHRN